MSDDLHDSMRQWHKDSKISDIYISRQAWLMVDDKGNAVGVGPSREFIQKMIGHLGHKYTAVRVEYGGPISLDTLRLVSLKFSPLLASFRDDKTEVKVTEEQVNDAFKVMAEVDKILRWAKESGG